MGSESISAHISRASMGIAALMLAVLLLQRYRANADRHLQLWAYGWIALAVYHGVYAFARSWTGAGDGPLSLARLLPSWLATSAIYSAGALFVVGSEESRRGAEERRPRVRKLLTAALALGLATTILSAFLDSSARYLIRVGLSTLWLGTALFIAAWLVRRAARAKGLRTSFLSVTAVLFGLLYLHYFVGVTGYVIWDWPIGYFRSLGPLDLLLVFSVGVGMLVWQLEEERRRAVAATDALRESEKRLRQSQKMEAIGQLAGGIAHDFNNILTIILGHGETLTENKINPEVDEAASQIMKASRRATSLTQRLLSFSRRQVVQPVAVDINDLLGEIRALSERVVGERIRIRVAPSARSLVVKIDPGQLTQALLNLVINARDAMPNGGEIALGARDLDGPGAPRCVVTVEDTGHGMDGSTLELAFDPFFTTKGELGTGLGLPTAQSVIEQAGGEMRIESSPGEGTCVSLVLPLTDEDSSIIEREHVAPNLAGARALLVEDDDGVRDLVWELLTDQGVTVVTARDAESAKTLFAQERFDLLITDVVLSGMSGVTLVDAARAGRPDLPTVLMTGYAATAAELLSGTDHVVVKKPFTRGELFEGVSRAVARARARVGSGV